MRKEEGAQRLTSYFVHIPKYQYVDPIRKNKVHRSCSTHESGEKGVQGSGGKARRKQTTWKTEA
jgi:hypothetical protein